MLRILALAVLLVVAQSVTTITADYIIVGGGVAGLTAAKKLKADGKTFVLVEATNRIGGRVMTMAAGGKTVNVGVAWHMSQSSIASNFSYPIPVPAAALFKDSPGDGTLYQRGTATARSSTAFTKADPADWINGYVSDNVGRDILNCGEMKDSVGKYLDDATVNLTKYKDVEPSWARQIWLNYYFDASYGTSASQLSPLEFALWSGRSYSFVKDNSFDKFVTDTAISAFGENYITQSPANKLFLNQAVSKVSWTDDTVTVESASAGGNSPHKFEGKYLIFTASIKVLKAMTFAPVLSTIPARAPQWAAIQKLNMVDFDPYIFVFDKVFWKDEQYIYIPDDSGKYITFMNLAKIIDPSLFALKLDATGAMAAYLKPMSDADIIKEVETILKGVFQTATFSITGMVKKRWSDADDATSKYTLGAQANIPLDFTATEFYELMQNKHPIYFAGEAFDGDFGLIQGAVHSAFHAVNASYKLNTPLASSCGDGLCTGTETCTNCPGDCLKCACPAGGVTKCYRGEFPPLMTCADPNLCVDPKVSCPAKPCEVVDKCTPTNGAAQCTYKPLTDQNQFCLTSGDAPVLGWCLNGQCAVPTCTAPSCVTTSVDGCTQQVCSFGQCATDLVYQSQQFEGNCTGAASGKFCAATCIDTPDQKGLVDFESMREIVASFDIDWTNEKDNAFKVSTDYTDDYVIVYPKGSTQLIGKVTALTEFLPYYRLSTTSPAQQGASSYDANTGTLTVNLNTAGKETGGSLKLELITTFGTQTSTFSKVFPMKVIDPVVVTGFPSITLADNTNSPVSSQVDAGTVLSFTAPTCVSPSDADIMLTITEALASAPTVSKVIYQDSYTSPLKLGSRREYADNDWATYTFTCSDFTGTEGKCDKCDVVIPVGKSTLTEEQYYTAIRDADPAFVAAYCQTSPCPAEALYATAERLNSSTTPKEAAAFVNGPGKAIGESFRQNGEKATLCPDPKMFESAALVVNLIPNSADGKLTQANTDEFGSDMDGFIEGSMKQCPDDSTSGAKLTVQQTARARARDAAVQMIRTLARKRAGSPPAVGAIKRFGKVTDCATMCIQNSPDRNTKAAGLCSNSTVIPLTPAVAAKRYVAVFITYNGNCNTLPLRARNTTVARSDQVFVYNLDPKTRDRTGAVTPFNMKRSTSNSKLMPLQSNQLSVRLFMGTIAKTQECIQVSDGTGSTVTINVVPNDGVSCFPVANGGQVALRTIGQGGTTVVPTGFKSSAIVSPSALFIICLLLVALLF